MTIGTITVDLLAKTGSFETDINRAAKLAEKRSKEMEASLNRLTVKTVAVGSAMGDAITAGIQKAMALVPDLINGLDALNDVKDATGSTIENISALEDVALRTGTSMDAVSGIMIKFNKVLQDADGKNEISKALKAIGLDAADLRKEDPAEALRQTAVALSGFADDGDKARLIQLAFGKSVKEAAPFLNDLAEKTKLVGTVSSDAAANAEIFNKQIFEIEKNALDAKRALLEGLLPALNLFLKNARDIKAMGGFGLIVKDAAKDMIGLGSMTGDNGADIKKFMSERERLQKNLNFANKKGLPTRDIEGDMEENARYLALLRAKQANEVAAANMGQDYGDAISRKIAPKPSVGKIDKPGPKGKADHTAEQEAKAQLAQDLEDMKKSTAALTGAFDNGDKILSAMRAASLVGDADYYAAKRDMMMASDKLEEEGLQRAIDRLAREQASLSGKDAIDNQRKLNDAKAALDKHQADASTNLTALSIEAKGSADKLTNSMIDARDAAQSFLDVTNRARALEVAGMGRGDKSRSMDAAISQIEQTYEEKRQDLERDNRNGKFAGRKDDYARELALINEFQKKSIDSYRDYYDQIELRQKSFSLGASEAARNYFDESQNAFKQTQEAVSSAFKGMEDALVDFVKTGKLDFKSLIDSIITDIARIAIKQSITGPLAGMLSGAFNFGGASGPTADQMKAFDLVIGGIAGARAGGGPVGSGKTYLVGEKGPELFTPNTAGAIIPNDALGGGGAPVIVTINNTVGDVATLSMLKEAQAGTERRIAGALGRSQRYGGSLG